MTRWRTCAPLASSISDDGETITTTILETTMPIDGPIIYNVVWSDYVHIGIETAFTDKDQADALCVKRNEREDDERVYRVCPVTLQGVIDA